MSFFKKKPNQQRINEKILGTAGGETCWGARRVTEAWISIGLFVGQNPNS